MDAQLFSDLPSLSGAQLDQPVHPDVFESWFDLEGASEKVPSAPSSENSAAQPQGSVQPSAAPAPSPPSNAVEMPSISDFDDFSAGPIAANEQLPANMEASFQPTASEMPVTYNGLSASGPSAAQMIIPAELYAPDDALLQQIAEDTMRASESASSSGAVDSPQHVVDDEFADVRAFIDALPEPEQQSAAQGPGNAPIDAMGTMQPAFQAGFFSAAVQQAYQTVYPAMDAQASYPAENAAGFGMGYQLPLTGGFPVAQPQGLVNAPVPAMGMMQPAFQPGVFSAASQPHQTVQPAMAAQASFPPENAFGYGMGYQLPQAGGFSAAMQAPVQQPAMQAQYHQLLPGPPMDAQGVRLPAAQPAVAQPAVPLTWEQMDGPTQAYWEARLKQILRDEHKFVPGHGRSSPCKERKRAIRLLVRGDAAEAWRVLHRFAYRANNQTMHRAQKKQSKASSAVSSGSSGT